MHFFKRAEVNGKQLGAGCVADSFQWNEENLRETEEGLQEPYICMTLNFNFGEYPAAGSSGRKEIVHLWNLASSALYTVFEDKSRDMKFERCIV